MRNTGGHSFGDQKNSVESAEHQRGGEFSMASFQLDELLKELSKEAGFKTRSGTAQKNSKKKGMITTKDGAGRTFLSWETEDGVGAFKDQKPTQMRGGYFSEADIDVDKTVNTSPKQKVINIEYRPKQRCYSAKVIEKTQTRQEYIKEEYLGNKGQSSGANRLEDQVAGTIAVDGRASAFGTLSNEMSGRQFQSQKMYSSDVEGIKVAPIPPPRKHIASPDHSFTSSSTHFQASRQQREPDFFSNTLSPVSSTSTLRKGRFETTNSQHLSPPLEVKGIAPASSTYEEHHWLEEQKRKLDRSRYSVDRITSTGRGIDHSFRSGSLDIDLDDLVQRNLTNRSVAVHQISSTPGGSEVGSVEKGSYYISGIERPAVRTKLPQTKYIFKITSPDDTIKAPAPKKVEKEVFTTHIRAPPIPPSPQLDPGIVSESNLRDLESSLKLMLDNTDNYKEEEHFNKKLRPKKDDEVISLEPIGPGVQLLEPEIGTLRGQTLRYQETGMTPRMESRSDSLARHVATPRTLSPSNQGCNTLNNYPNQTSNFAMYETYSRQANSNPQQTTFQPPVPTNMPSHFSRKDTLEYVKPADNFAAQHLQTGSQQQQHHQQQQQQHFQQQQQVQPLGAGYQPCFVSSPIGGGFRSEYSSMSYTQTLSNGPVSYPHSMPTSPMMGPKPLECISTNQSQHEISVPIAVEGRKSNTSNILLSDSSSQRHISSSASNFNHQESGGSSYSVNQAAKESDLISSSRQIPVIQEQAKADDAYVAKGSTGSLAGSYKLEDRVTESYTVVDNASHHASPDVNRSWTVSPSSNIVATNSFSCKIEGQSERRTESSNAQIVENQSASQISLTDYEAKLVRDTAHIWHKPHITRQEAVEMLRNKPSGSFVVRNSHSFAGGYGLALKVSHLPPNVQAKGDDYEANLVRHYLIESTPKGVKLKGCSNEPVFPSLSALIYQHSITPLSLPCKLIMPEADKKPEVKMDGQIVESDYANYSNSTTNTTNSTTNNNNNNSAVVSNFSSYSAATTQNTNNNNMNTATTIVKDNNNTGTLTSVISNFSTKSLGVSESSSHHGPALYLDSFNTESLTGPEAMWKAINMILEQNWKNLSVIKVDFRVSTQGVVLTDSKHKLFFRRHYPLDFISHCAVEQSGKSWNITDNEGRKYSGRVFGFVARKVGSQAHNTCHLFLEIDPKFSATTVVTLINGLQQQI